MKRIGLWPRIPTAVTSGTYNANNQLTTWGGATLTYDNNGNMTNDGTNTFTWNARNQLASISGGTTASFRYDAFGRRRGKTIAGTITDFLYDGVNPVQELSGGTPTANMIAGLGIDQMLSRADSAGTRSLLTDALGSTVALTDSAGAVQTQYTYEPFGKTTVAGASNSSSYQYTGRENDATGLYFYRARYYNPTLQRFMSEDPLDFGAGDVNLYSYVRNSPTRVGDPIGLKPPTSFPLLRGLGRTRAASNVAANRITDPVGLCATQRNFQMLAAPANQTQPVRAEIELSCAPGQSAFVLFDTTRGVGGVAWHYIDPQGSAAQWVAAPQCTQGICTGFSSTGPVDPDVSVTWVQLRWSGGARILAAWCAIPELDPSEL